MIGRRRFLKRAGMAAISALMVWGTTWTANAAPETPPNFLVIVADDCTYNDLSVYGGRNAETPSIERLASEGMVFNRAYLAASMCQPSRAELMTGLYPVRNGCAWNHSTSRSHVTSMPHHLRSEDYRVGIAGKVHVAPKDVFPFTEVEGFDGNAVRNPTRPHELQGIRQFMAGSKDEPFCLVVALVEPHVPWVMGDASKYPPEELKLPPNVADTPRTREDYSRYLAEISFMDSQVGEILGVLDESGKANNTLVMFTSEQGSQFPGNKWTNWDTGLHTGLIARWPGRIEPNGRTDALVQYADVLPTLVHAAGGNVAEHDYDGTSFLPVLLGEKSNHREFVYGLHNNIPEGPAYPIRTISDGRYRYIRNLRPDEIYIQKYLMGRHRFEDLNNPYWATWIRDSWNNPDIYDLVKRYMHRPPEELYCTAEDPYELTNLIDDSGLAEVKERLSDELDAWMEAQGDSGASLDTHEAYEAAGGRMKHK